MLKKSLTLLVLLLLLGANHLRAQKIQVSQEIDLKADFKYEVLPMKSGHFLVFKDEGFEQSLTGFDEDLSIKWKKKLSFEKKRIGLIGLIPQGDVFDLFYFFRVQEDIFIIQRRYSEAGSLLRADTLIQEKYLTGIPSYYFAHSPEKKAVVIFTIDRKDKVDAYGVLTDSSTVVWNSKVEDAAFNLRNAFRDVLVRDDGRGYIVFEANNTWPDRKDHQLTIVSLGQNEAQQDLELGGFLTYDMHTELSKDQNTLYLAGTYSERPNNKCNGTWVYQVKLDQNMAFQRNVTSFDRDLPPSPNLEKVETKKGIPDLVLRKIIPRSDGGMVLFCESSKEYVRRPSFTTSSAITRRWVDYYFEDILVLSTEASGELSWYEVLHKKQYSQDDNAAFSSFFVFQLPSQVRLVYNDEIRSANTVSEYIVNSSGMDERKSLMSTENQDLQLQFRDAVQLDNRSMLVPGLKDGDMVLVKITYDRL